MNIKNELQALVDCVSVYGDVEGLADFVNQTLNKIIEDINEAGENKCTKLSTLVSQPCSK